MIDDANITDYRQILLDIARSLGAENLLNAWTMCRMRNWIDEYGEITSDVSWVPWSIVQRFQVCYPKLGASRVIRRAAIANLWTLSSELNH